MTFPGQEKFAVSLGAITNAYVEKIDISSNFHAQGLVLLNYDSSIVITISFDGGTTDHIDLDPSVAAGFIFDNFHADTVKAKAASSTPKLLVLAWA